MADRLEFQGKLGWILEEAKRQDNRIRKEEIEKYFEDDHLSDEQMELVSQLYTLGKSNPDVKAIAWRALYWDAVSRHDRKETQHALALIRQAEKSVDRTRFGYDYKRIRRSRMLFELGAKNDLYGLYSAQYADLDYFMRIGDKKGIGSCHLMIGKVLIDIGEPLRALGENEKAVAMFRESDTPALLASAEMNTALCHLRLGEIDSGLAILQRLERGQVARVDSFFRATVLLNISYAYSQTEKKCPYRYIKWMEEYSRKGSNEYARNMCKVNVASWLYRHGHNAEAMELLSETLDYAIAHGLDAWRENCYFGLAQCLVSTGDSLGAVVYFQQYAGLVDSLRFSDMKVKILRDEEVSRIRRFDEAMQAEKAASELRFMYIMAAAALLLLVLGGVCLWYWYKNKRAAMRLIEEQMDNERKRLAIEAQNRKIAISTIEMEEKNNTLRHIGSMVDDAKGRNEIGTAVAGRIKAQVKVHLDTGMGDREVRDLLYTTIRDYRSERTRGTIAEFSASSYDETVLFARIGKGSLGGKGRGLAFIAMEMKANGIQARYPSVYLSIPRTVVITTELFDEFMALNGFSFRDFQEMEDEEILRTFLAGRMPGRLTEDLKAILRIIIKPLSIRSSSLLEDSHFQPFAGVYQTSMIPNTGSDEKRLEDLERAVKTVWASTYFECAKEYLKRTYHSLEEEKMAVILQQITGSDHKGYWYPNISGVARSLNYYPVPGQKAEDGVGMIAFGFGKIIVDEGTALRFCPAKPKAPSSASLTTESSSQDMLYALDMNAPFDPLKDSDNLTFIPLQEEAARSPMALRGIASTFDMATGQLSESPRAKGERMITFNGILKYDMLPLAKIIDDILKYGHGLAGTCPVRRFAVDCRRIIHVEPLDRSRTGSIFGSTERGDRNHGAAGTADKEQVKVVLMRPVRSLSLDIDPVDPVEHIEVIDILGSCECFQRRENI